MQQANESDIKLICFDLGGVLVQIIHDWADAYRAGGWPLPEDANDANWPHRDPRFHQLVDDYESGNIDCDSFFEQVAQQFQLESTEQAEAAIDAVLRGAYPGIPELLEVIHNSGLATACLSNTCARHWQVMLNHDDYAALQGLQHHFASHLIGARKPTQSVYKHVEMNTSFRPSQILFFDDKPENIEAARNRGWHAHRIDPHADPVSQMRDYLSSLGLLKHEL